MDDTSSLLKETQSQQEQIQSLQQERDELVSRITTLEEELKARHTLALFVHQ